MSQIIAPRLCAYCHEAFTPKREAQKYCAAPARCRWNGPAERLRGIVPEAAVRGKQQRDAAAIQQRESALFGPLSERELAIYRHAFQRGYDVGYGKMWRPRRNGSAA